MKIFFIRDFEHFQRKYRQKQRGSCVFPYKYLHFLNLALILNISSQVFLVNREKRENILLVDETLDSQLPALRCNVIIIS